jgi:dienelactone hydrolase
MPDSVFAGRTAKQSSRFKFLLTTLGAACTFFAAASCLAIPAQSIAPTDAQLQPASKQNEAVSASALPSASLDERVVMVPGISGSESVQLETTIFKPPGDGPFPLVIMNHGKSLGNPHQQSRDRFVVLSREFVKRGYAVVIPMRKGFAHSSGNYVEYSCDMESNGQAQANDLQAAMNYVIKQKWADKSRILVAGQSYGGLTALAFGTRSFPGVRGLINFAGGLRIYGGDCDWQGSLTEAFADFGRHTAVPSLWFYGANDSHFNPELAARLHQAYVGGGGNAELVAFGSFKNDAHGMSGSWDGVKVWWPETEKFLKRIGMPTQEVLALVDDNRIPKTDFAALDNVDAVPYLKSTGRDAYRAFLGKSLPRAFAVSETGAWSWAEDGDDPNAQALANCEKQSPVPCKLYAVNKDVVWSETAPPQMADVPTDRATTGK